MNRTKNSRLSKEEIKKIKQMSLDGKSLRKISKIMDLGITTVYYQVRKFKPKQRKEFIVNLSDEKIGELIGAFTGDGSYYYSVHKKTGHHKIRYTLSLKDDYIYGKYLISLLKELNLNPFLYKREKYNAFEIIINSLSFIKFIKQFVEWKESRCSSIKLINNIDSYSKDFLIGFARGLMDTDGYVEISNVSCASISEQLIKNLKEIFEKIGLKYKITKKIRNGRKDLFLIRVYRESLKDYKKIIGFSNIYKLQKLNKILKNGVGRI